MKKYFFLCLAFILSNTLQAQVYGNGNIATQTRYMEDITKLLVNINGEVHIICGSDESKIEITYDENILDLVAAEKTNGFLELGQKKWIEGTKEVKITVYTKELQYLHNDSWSKVKLSNVDQESLVVESSISDVQLIGKVNDLTIISKRSDIDAFQLTAQSVKATVTGRGNVYVNAIQNLEVDCNEDGIVKYKGMPNKISGMASSSNKVEKRKPIDTRFIKLKLKNNSFSKIHAYVKGPKPDGNYFSYGLSFFPMATKKETWSIGTKLYRINKLGAKVLLHEVRAEDEGKTIKLRKKKNKK